METGTLLIVATPIGNLADITLRALEVLKAVNLVLAEDTRRTGQLLAHYSIQKPLLSYFDGNEEKRIPEIIDRLKAGENIALVSDAGTPLISDPGFKLVREAIKEGISVDSIPGPSAIPVALTLSGLPPDKFLFLGYLPKTEGKAEKIIVNAQKIATIQSLTFILYESPYRLIKTLNRIQKYFGGLEVVVCRELTKLHQEVKRGKAAELIEYFEKTSPKGEFTILWSGI